MSRAVKLYFDDKSDARYYRITHDDLEQRKIALKDFLQPVYDLLTKDKDFRAIQTQQPELLKQLARLKTTCADRMDSPKRLMELLD